MTRIINTLYEQQYYTVWIDKNIEQAKTLLESTNLVISNQETIKIDGVNQHMLSIKDSFLDGIKDINVSFIKKLYTEEKVSKPEKIMLGSDEKNIYISLLTKENKEFQSLKLSLYFEKIEDMLNAAIEAANFETMQIGYINTPPMKFLLQPIILEESELSVNTIDATVSIYEDGLIIIDFDLLFHDVPFLQLQNFETDDDKEYYLKRKCRIPELLINNITDTPNKYNNKKITVNEAISLYTDHITEVLEKSLDHRTIYKYINYNLIKYEGEPENFNSVSGGLREDLYWIINMPRYYTEMSKSTYDQFISNSHEVTKNAALFVSSVGRSVIAMTKEKIKVYNEELSEDAHKFTLKNYVDPVIRTILIKKMYYHKIWNHNETGNDYDLNEKESMIFFFKDRISKITHKSYGSVKRCIDFFEKNMVDYLNFKEVDEIIVNFKSKKYLDMTEKNEKLNRRINHLIVLITILFSYNPLDAMLTGLKESNIINLSEYLYMIWLSFIVFTLIIIYIENIKIAGYVIFNWLKKLSASIRNKYDNFRAKG